MATAGTWFGFKSHGVAAKPGYSVFLLPWAGEFSKTDYGTRNQNSADLGGGYNTNGNVAAGTSLIAWDVWLEAGTYKIAIVGVTATNAGITTLQFDGVSKGTLDWYAGVAANNTYLELTGVVVPVAKLIRFQVAVLTKNGASTGGRVDLQSIAIIRTGA